MISCSHRAPLGGRTAFVGGMKPDGRVRGRDNISGSNKGRPQRAKGLGEVVVAGASGPEWLRSLVWELVGTKPRLPGEARRGLGDPPVLRLARRDSRDCGGGPHADNAGKLCRFLRLMALPSFSHAWGTRWSSCIATRAGISGAQGPIGCTGMPRAAGSTW